MAGNLPSATSPQFKRSIFRVQKRNSAEVGTYSLGCLPTQHAGPTTNPPRNSGFSRGSCAANGRFSTKPAREFRGVSDRVRLSVPAAGDSLTLAA